MMLAETTTIQVNSPKAILSESSKVQQFSPQKPKNDLIYVCESDANNKLNCRWIQGCLI